MSTGIKAARAATAAALGASLARTPVYGYEPKPGGLPLPVAVTVASAGASDTEWLLVVRVYSSVRVGDFAVAQDTLDDAMEATDAALADVPVPRSSWQVQYVDEHEAIVATTVVTYPRDDF